MKSILTPHITEKAYTTISEEKGAVSQYTFRVPRTLSKEEVKKQVEKAFNVHVTDVRVINLPAKTRIFKGHRGSTQARRKAIVRLQAGERIAAFTVESAQEPEATTK